MCASRCDRASQPSLIGSNRLGHRGDLVEVVRALDLRTLRIQLVGELLEALGGPLDEKPAICRASTRSG